PSQPSHTPFPYTTLFRSTALDTPEAGAGLHSTVHSFVTVAGANRYKAVLLDSLRKPGILGWIDPTSADGTCRTGLRSHRSGVRIDRKSTRLNSSHDQISY